MSVELHNPMYKTGAFQAIMDSELASPAEVKLSQSKETVAKIDELQQKYNWEVPAVLLVRALQGWGQCVEVQLLLWCV